jgi:hypothetical protein
MTQRAGFPHSDIRGSKGARPSPRLYAACHVLHRFLVPRHPPDALRRLISATRRDNARPTAGPIPRMRYSQERLTKIRSHLATSPMHPKVRGPAPRSNLDRTYSPCQTAKQFQSPPQRAGRNLTSRANPGRSLSFREDLSPRTLLPSAHPRNLQGAAWWRRTGSNRRPQACKASALPTELRPLKACPGQDALNTQPGNRSVVGRAGFEPATSRLSSARSNQLSYQPKA